ncbi:MAG: hypothetical protein A2Y03_04050 [Omnitrophica WOR_2 bacterium GWF2_38_59]|nr:MAG: hypothetical protein A2Y06_06760 [Omnitrophica WOR_2 bacterium GWA2_37_7]OGX25553.1 MAG: hypothetical protein A2Y03_04050 [Omnitrophica WOR_2 bacterium GWF2_38_59]OGX50172.1 MAG: hypothetical protein A2243_08530 [Omnitrophica WOR_2 bacterium RIFOXYA2_FULL_38_17]OGX52798.1 MAG: hypothetical protein A2267_07555 [Omnitrophica WOR_2 bacterium RIFOXYA12_FULL_38_10]OGX57486.1 MAG: hypothetical protein A2447_03350 [Omnitrophica WOR_2 bacterium RIFOXYC2_FULL_38_12]OGX59193.1 MAG: hypothetical 
MNAKLKRDIVLVGHAHTGKTTLAESLLFAGGSINRKGDVLQGNSVSDFNEDERNRQISINLSLLNTTYKDHKIQIIDTPGYSDFIGETISALRAADAAVVVVDAVNGVEVGTEDVWQRMEKLNMPKVIFINKTEKEGANVNDALASIRELLSPKAMIIDFGSSELMEAVAESDDELLMKYLDGESLSDDEVKNGLKKAVLENKLYPVIVGSAVKDEGVNALLEAIVSYCPSPLEHKAYTMKVPSSDEEKIIEPTEDGPMEGMVFKSMYDAHLGNIALMKILRGKINTNDDVYNATTSTKEHIGVITVLQGKDQSSVSSASCGDIVALTKLKNTHVGDTLCDAKEKLLVRPLEFPSPSISASIKPKTRADEEKISNCLHRLCEEDHTFRVDRNEETKELLISGIGDLHLKVMVDRMKSRFNVEVDLGTPKVTYRETITKKGKARYKYKKQSGGHGQYGDVDLEIEPLPKDGQDYEFVNKIFGGAIPKNFIPSIEKGARKTLDEGVLAGYPINHVRVIVVDGSYHDVDSSDMAFQIAAAHAMKEAIKTAGPVLLEPIMEVSIVVTDDFIGQISGDISARRGRIMGTEARGKKDVITAHIPLGEMFSYANDLRSMTQGRGSYSMKMSHYENAPAKITERVISENTKT